MSEDHDTNALDLSRLNPDDPELVKVHPLVFIDRSEMPDLEGKSLTEELVSQYRSWNLREDRRLQSLDENLGELSHQRLVILRQMLSRELNNLMQQHQREHHINSQEHSFAGNSILLTNFRWHTGLLPIFPVDAEEEESPYDSLVDGPVDDPEEDLDEESDDEDSDDEEGTGEEGTGEDDANEEESPGEAMPLLGSHRAV